MVPQTSSPCGRDDVVSGAVSPLRPASMPFTSPRSTAQQHPFICAVDRGMVKGMLAGLYGDTAPETTSSRPQGDDVCVTTV